MIYLKASFFQLLCPHLYSFGLNCAHCPHLLSFALIWMLTFGCFQFQSPTLQYDLGTQTDWLPHYTDQWTFHNSQMPLQLWRSLDIWGQTKKPQAACVIQNGDYCCSNQINTCYSLLLCNSCCKITNVTLTIVSWMFLRMVFIIGASSDDDDWTYFVDQQSSCKSG